MGQPEPWAHTIARRQDTVSCAGATPGMHIVAKPFALRDIRRTVGDIIAPAAVLPSP